MKRLFFPLIAGLLLSCVHSPLQAQDEKEKARETKQKQKEEDRKERYKSEYPEQFKEHISKQYPIQKTEGSILTIYNLEGSIKVEGYAGDKVVIEVDKTISAKTQTVLEEGKKEVKLGFEQIGDSVVAYMIEPWDTRPHDWGNRDRWEDHKKIEYRCNLEYTVKVPFNMALRISTINDGEILVKDVSGLLHVNNVNGGITVVNAKATTKAHTVNGLITINYLSNPVGDCSYYTVNGKITVTYPSNLSADLQFKSMNGAYYTDFANVEVLPTKVNITKDKRGDGTLYKINKNSDVRIGSGGKLFKFETLNGNIYIQKQS
jgi:DUF4097 and DUF4098 domain-containing protein YvlB